MKLHEYQAKEILQKWGIPIQRGHVLESPEEAEACVDKVADEMRASQFVIKAQIHAGGRGKGGGIQFCSNQKIAMEKIRTILGMKLVTHQTGPQGQRVRKVMVTEALDIDREFYTAITLDRSKGKPVLIVSQEGGVDIEKIAAERPESIHRVWIDPFLGIRSFQLRRLAKDLSLSGDLAKQATQLFRSLYRVYVDIDALLVEINPLVVTRENSLVALDAKLSVDDNALPRQKSIASMRDLHEEDPTEVEAGNHRLNYIKLNGDVGCMVNGAGLAMATMDIIKQKGGHPANFLDVGGGANVDTIKNGFKIILLDASVKAVLINIFGGIVRCDRVANGIVAAIKELDLKIPIVVRLAGTNAKEAKSILSASGVALQSASTLDDAAELVVEVSRRDKG